MIWAEIGTGIAVLALVYTFLRNFRADIKESIDGLSARMDRTDDRITSLEERMFLMATGKTLVEAIIEEKIKRGLKT